MLCRVSVPLIKSSLYFLGKRKCRIDRPGSLQVWSGLVWSVPRSMARCSTAKSPNISIPALHYTVQYCAALHCVVFLRDTVYPLKMRGAGES